MKDEKDLTVQVEVLEKVHREDSRRVNENPDENVTKFIITNAPFFRYFAEHLSPELRSAWEKAKRDKSTYDIISDHYLEFRKEVEGVLETMDPDTRTALTEAAERSDINTFAHILETHMKMSARPKED